MQSRKRSEIVFVTASISFQNALNTSSADFHVSFHHFRTVSLIKSINAVSAPIKTSTTLIITSMEVLTKSTINGTAYATIHSKRGCKTDSQNVCKHSAILPITSITVLRNGQLVGQFTTAELPRVQLVAKMMGKDFDDLAAIKNSRSEEKHGDDDVVIKAVGLGKKGYIKPFDLVIHKGEVVGFTGLLGSGRSETVRVLYGAEKPDEGELKVNGKTLTARHPLMSMNAGMAYLPEDRKNEGIIADLSVRENLIMALQAKRGIFHLLSRKQQEEFTDKYIEMLQIKTASRETPIKSLSGGNQQKVIIGRWLLTNPDFLILDEPTRGIDVGTKTEIQKLVVKLAEQGMAVVFISSEIEEMLRTCDRMVVMRDGTKVGELSNDEMNQSTIMSTIAGGQ